MAKARLTKQLVDTTEAQEKELFVWDRDLAGFGLRVWPSGRKAFVAQFRVGGGAGGKSRRITIGTYPKLKIDEARTRAREVLARAQLGDDPALDRDRARSAQSVSDLVELWRAEAAHVNRRTGAIRSLKNVAGEIGRINAHVLPLLGQHRLVDLTRADIERLRDQIARGASRRVEKTKLRGRARVRGGVGTAARTVRLLSSIFAFAVDRGLLKENPARGVRLAPGRVMNRFLTRGELGSLGEALQALQDEGRHPSAITVIRLLALTGARRSEISTLRWGEVDEAQSMLRLASSKTGAKIIPLNPPALQIIEQISRHDGSPYVFPAMSGDGPFQGLGKVWSEAKVRAGLDGVRLHDLRHTFASFGASGNFGLPVIGAILGHRQSSTTQRYAHLSDDPVRYAANRIGTEIAEALSARHLDVVRAVSFQG